MKRYPRAYAAAFVAVVWLLASALHTAGSAQPARAQDEPRYQAYLPRLDTGAGKAIDTRIALSDHIACRLDEWGGALCWDVENGTRMPSPAGNYVQLSVGGEGICGLRTDGQVVCDGIYGTGAWSAPPGAYTQVRVSLYSACALTDTGAIACWLWEGFWEGFEGPRSFPGPSGEFEQVAVADDFVCGLKADGTLACVDWKAGGPQWPGPFGGIAQIEMDPWTDGEALLLLNDGSTRWWELASGAFRDGPRGPFRRISWRDWPACGLDAQGAMHCWGSRNQSLPAPAGAFRSVTAADGVVCAVGEAGTPACWRWDWDHDLWEPLPMP